MNVPTAQPFSCCLTGLTSFAIQCGEALLSAGHSVVVVVSSNREVVAWATGCGIPVISDFDSMLAGESPASFDYLFSAINGVILRDDVLRLPRRAAVNYHNAPLPRYAGVHAASWAILNGETTHGVTWHEMTQRIDGGPIVAQRTFSIENTATAGEVNDTCRATGLELFVELVRQFENEEVRPIAQDLALRTYYPGHRKHASGGLISWSCDAASIARLVGAHQTGSVINTFGSAKIDLGGGRSAVVGTAGESAARSGTPPGTVVSAGDSRLRVATRTNDVDLAGITDFSGRAMDFGVDRRSGLPTVGHVLPTVATALGGQLAQRLESLAPYERWCAQVLETVDPRPLPHPQARGAPTRTATTIDCSRAPVPAELVDLLVLSATVLAVREYTGWQRVSVGHPTALATTDSHLRAYLRRGLPLTVTFDRQSAEADVMGQIAAQLRRAAGRDTFARDIGVRRKISVIDENPIRAGASPLVEDDMAGAQLGVLLDVESERLELISDPGPTWNAYPRGVLTAFGRRVRACLEVCANHTKLSQ